MTIDDDQAGPPAGGSGSGRRWERGWDTLTRVNASPRARIIEELQSVAPELARQVVEFAYGESYSREELAPRDRQLVTIGMLTAMGGAEPQLEVHLHVALNVGLSREEITEAIIHTAPFCGFPRAINAMLVAARVFEKRSLPSPEAAGPAVG